MLRTGIAFLFISLLYTLPAQVVINEASNRNFNQVYDEDSERNDWIELYNTSNTPVNLTGWALSDKSKKPALWEFGDIDLAANSFLLIHASGKNRKATGMNSHWESAILPTDTFKYVVPTVSTSSAWNQPGFDDGTWEKGQAGFGFGDNDDRTVVPTGSIAVFIRRTFFLPNTSAITDAIFHVDYDDGFIAYLNGKVIARANVNENAGWNTTANGNREALMYSGGVAEAYKIDPILLKSVLVEGENVFAVQVHNVNNSSSDMSLIPFLSFSMKEGFSLFSPTPDWFRGNTPEQLHSNFKISGKGEMIFLSFGGEKTDSLFVPRLMTNHSIGRTKDGAAQIGLFTKATPGASNNLQVANPNGYSDRPSIHPPAGYYTSYVDVIISSPEENAILRYTLDGSEPTTNSTLYTSPVRLTSTKSLKARSFVTGKIPGESSTSTYLINEDYSLPVLSVTTNNANLYGSTGIFTNWRQSWNIPSHVEYFDKDKKLAFAQFAGMQVDGGAGGSRSHPQHSFRIEPGNGSLGDGDLKYKLMKRRPERNNFPSFYLRNGSNQHLKLQYKDGLQVTALGRNTYTYYSAYEPIVVFINGSYFGVYELREKINYDYLVDNYGMDIDSLDLLGVSYFKGQRFEALRGSIDPYLENSNNFQQFDIQSANYLDDVDQFLDIQNYTDYIIAESWVGNNDWPNNNIKVFRCKGTNMRWQWAINDLEWALNPNGWTTSTFNHINYMIGKGRWNNFTGFWYNMIQNPEYKAYFVNRFADLMNTNYLFSEIGSLENEMYNELLPEMEGQYKRWGTSNIASQMNTFTNNHNTFRSELERRSSFVRAHLQSYFGLKNLVTVTLDVEPPGAGSIRISTITPTGYPWDGIYFTDIPVEIEAIPNKGYRFDQWSNNTLIDDIYSDVVSGKFTTTKMNFKAYFEVHNELISKVVISEFNYKPGENFDSPDWIEFCNYGDTAVNLNGWYFTDDNPKHVFDFQNDLFLSPGERVVVTANLSKFRKVYPNVSVYQHEFSFGLGTPTDEINLFNNNHELIASVHYSDNYPWPLNNDNTGCTMELRTAGSEPTNPDYWFRGCIGGSPGTAFLNCDETKVSTPTVIAGNIEMKAYPIPAKEVINVDIKLTENDNRFTISLYDVMGNVVDEITEKQANTGWHTLQFSLEKARGNILFLKVSTNSSEKVMKIVRIN